MYFTGRLSIDPAQATVIERQELQGPFKKLLNFLTKEDITPEEEIETFSAVHMLKDLREAFQQMGMTNLIRLSKNGVIFYVDEEGNEEDLEPAVEEFSEVVGANENACFHTLSLALEHRREGWHYLVEVHVEREHGVGAYPLNIKINAFPEMQFPSEVTGEWIRGEMRKVCVSQAAFDSFFETGRTAFSGFMEELKAAIQAQVEITDVKQQAHLRLVRPRETVSEMEQVATLLEKGRKSFFPEDFDPDPIFAAYPRFMPYLYTCMQWGGACHHENLICRNMEVVDGLGRTVMTVGAAGLFAGATTTLNPSAPFEAAKGGDITYFDENAFFNEVDRLRLMK